MADFETLRDLVGAYVTEQCDVLLAGDVSLRSPGSDVPRARTVHRTRVAARRLRSTLRVYGELFELPRAGRLEEELRWWAGVLGGVRDLDVMEVRLEAQLDALPAELLMGPVRARLAEVVATRRHDAVLALGGVLVSERYAALLVLLQAWRTDPPFTADADRPAAKVSRFVRRADRKVARRLADGWAGVQRGDPDADEVLHRARKAGKRHRYAVEAAEPLWGERAAAVVERRKELQEVLGDHQDSAVATAFLRELAASTGGEAGVNGFTWGLLYAREQAAGVAAVERLRGYL